MNNTLLYLLTIAILFFSTGCVRDVDLTADSGPTAVVDCVLTDGPVQSLRLFYTDVASKQEKTIPDDVEVKLYDVTEERLVGFFLRGPDSNDWTLDYFPSAGHAYRLEIDISGEKEIWAEQVMPAQHLSVLSIYSSAFPIEYLSSLVKYVYHLSETVSNTCWIYGLNYNTVTGEREIAEDIYTDYPDVDNFNVTGEVFSSSPDDQYGASSLLDGSAIHRRYLRIPPRKYGDTFFILSGSFTGEYFGDQKILEKDMGVVEAMFVSDEYDLFLREVILLAEQQQSFDIANLFMRHNIYSNIHGGIGFFGAKSVMSVRWYKNNYFGFN